MQEIKIPDGCKASIDFEKRVVVIEQDKPKFNNGDIVYSNFCTLIYRGTNENGGILTDVFLINKYHRLRQKKVIKNGCGFTIDFRLATSYEQLLLFDALAKEGKKWNAETLQIEDIEKDILVPESIGIYRCREDFGDDGDGLYIAFNNNTQLLYYNSKYKVWCTIPLHSGYERVQCKLTPCKREDLRLGDTVAIVNEHLKIEVYNKAVGDREYASVEYGRNIQVYDEKISPKLSEHLFYKVGPTNN